MNEHIIVGIFPLEAAKEKPYIFHMPNFIAQAAQAIGAIPTGDPAALDAYARRLEMAAEIFERTSLRFDVTVESAGLNKGPFADRFKGEARLFSERTRRNLALESRELAIDVRHQASQLRIRQEDWRSRLRRVVARLEHEYLEKSKD